MRRCSGTSGPNLLPYERPEEEGEVEREKLAAELVLRGQGVGEVFDVWYKISGGRNGIGRERNRKCGTACFAADQEGDEHVACELAKGRATSACQQRGHAGGTRIVTFLCDFVPCVKYRSGAGFSGGCWSCDNKTRVFWSAFNLTTTSDPI